MAKEYRTGPLHVVPTRHRQSKRPNAPVARYIDFLAKFQQGDLKDRRDPAKLSQRSPKPDRPPNPKGYDIVT